MTESEKRSRIAKAQEVRLQRADEKALRDPVRLRTAARLFRQARARGLVDPDGNVVADIEQAEAS